MAERSLIPVYQQWEILKGVPFVKAMLERGMPSELVHDEEIQQKLVEATLVEQMTGEYGPKDRREAAIGLAKMKGFGADSKKKRVLEEIERIRAALEGKTVPTTGTEIP